MFGNNPNRKNRGGGVINDAPFPTNSVRTIGLCNVFSQYREGGGKGKREKTGINVKSGVTLHCIMNLRLEISVVYLSHPLLVF